MYLFLIANKINQDSHSSRVMFTLVPLGPSIRSPSLDILEHVFMLHLNLNAHVISTKMSLFHIFPRFYKATIVTTAGSQMSGANHRLLIFPRSTFISLLGLLSSSPDVTFTLVPLGPSIRSPSLDILEHSPIAHGCNKNFRSICIKNSQYDKVQAIQNLSAI
ncbi:hypothetical protein BpHYR1_027175 [Brachionus plicatilis]|uniref:Uncharacterized protein n=1 Tax=Brachionus plicatilis TaxID=10195 RepID=A0A3M7QPG2_BRAPC|nr:hypothetical protein BpHYR1_027175 [Brachionus plicatilis]